MLKIVIERSSDAMYSCCMENAKHIISAIGGLTATGEILGISAAAVHRWNENNRIPPLRMFQLRERRPDIFETIVTSPVTTRNRDTNPAADFSTPPSAGAY